MTERVCERCGTSIDHKRRSARFCSNDCYVKKATPRTIPCEQCGNLFETTRYNARFDSRECREAFVNDRRREKRAVALELKEPKRKAPRTVRLSGLICAWGPCSNPAVDDFCSAIHCKLAHNVPVLFDDRPQNAPATMDVRVPGNSADLARP